AAAAELVAALASTVRRIEILQRGDDARIVLRAEVEGAGAPTDDGVLRGWLADHPAVAGVVLQGKRWRRAWGDDRLALSPLPELTLTVRGGAFTQVNPAANRLLVEHVLALSGAGGADRVLDLYAGAGNLSLPL